MLNQRYLFNFFATCSFSLLSLSAGEIIAAGTLNESPPIPKKDATPASVVITNSLIKLGVNDEGHLNIWDAGKESRPPSSTTAVGLRLVFPDGSESEATAPGCLCEGWGIAANGTVAGTASVSNSPGISNLSNIVFTGGSDSATSNVDVGSNLRVKHDFHPSTSPNLYEITVTVTNISSLPITELKYRRVMDWDISPTTFDECVTIQSSLSKDIEFVSNNGFDSVNPLDTPYVDGYYYWFGDRIDDGPRDHGALFQIKFSDINSVTPLMPGEDKVFTLYYGAAFNQTDAETALATVGAEAFSFGKPHDGSGKCTDNPNVFIFGFSSHGNTTCLGLSCTIQGTDSDDFLVGTDDDDVICGGKGNDIILGAQGDDVMCGGNGDDLLIGNEGYDLMEGEKGDDLLEGDAHIDVLQGGVGNDTLLGDAGNDFLFGAMGFDYLSGGVGADVANAGSDKDICESESTASLMIGCEKVESAGLGISALEKKNLLPPAISESVKELKNMGILK